MCIVFPNILTYLLSPQWAFFLCDIQDTFHNYVYACHIYIDLYIYIYNIPFQRDSKSPQHFSHFLSFFTYY